MLINTVMAKTALITGATSGIGLATAKLFASAGYNLIIMGRRAERLKALKKEIKEKHDVKILVLSFDIKDRKSCEAAIESLPEFYRGVDVLVNNAGMASDLVKFQDGDPSNWDASISTNLNGLLYISRCVAKIMVANGSGHIVNIGSIAGIEPYEGGNAYVAAKHAVHGLTKSMRIDLLGTGVKVTEIRPGKVNTEFSLVRFHGDREAADKTYEGYTPLVGEDVAQAILWSVEQPPHVNIDEIALTPVAQASSYYLHKNEVSEQ